MIIASVAAVLVALGIGYFIGLWHQSREELLPDQPRIPDYEVINSGRWKSRKKIPGHERYLQIRGIDSHLETAHNVCLDQIIAPLEEDSDEGLNELGRVFVDAVKFDPKNGEIRKVVVLDEEKARKLSSVFKRTGIRMIRGSD